MGRISYLSLWIKRSFALLLPISFMLGIIVGNSLSLNIFSLILLIISAFLIFGKKFGLLIIFLSLGFLRSSNYPIMDENHIINFIGKKVIFEGEVKDYPYNKGLNQYVVVKPLRVTHENKETIISDGLVRVKISKFMDVEKGDIMNFLASIEEPKTNDDFDYKEYLRIQNVYGVINTPSQILVKKGENLYTKFLNGLRKNIVTKISNEFPQPHAKLLAGMVIGTREDFSERFTTSLSASGTAHIIAVSGYNITLIINSFLSLAGWLNRRKILIISLLTVVIFLGIVGYDNVPALRAGLMGSITIFAFLTGRKSHGLFLLFVVAAIMNLHNPLIYKSISFQLSFFATYGLITISKTVENILSKLIPSAVSEEAGTTISAILSTFPVTFINFSQFGIYSVLANIVVAPFVPIASLVGIVWLFISSIFEFLELPLRVMVWGSLEFIILVIEKIGDLPFATFLYEADPRPISLIVLLIFFTLIFETSYKYHLSNNA